MEILPVARGATLLACWSAPSGGPVSYSLPLEVWMVDAKPSVEVAGRFELIAMMLFGVGWLAAMLAIPTLAWVRMLQLAPDWAGSALLSSTVAPVGLGLLYAVVDGARRMRRR